MAAIDVDREARHASVLLLFLRRMRAPLLVLIVTYAVAIVGLVAIPGMDDHGRPIRISFLHAFYVVSYTATTIGFGETPYPFTAAQRLWASCWIYLTVVGWLYAIGKLLALMQDSGFQQVVQAARFARAVRRLREPFHVVCGLGETGSLFVTAIDDRGGRAVALDADVARVQALDVAALRVDVPALAADARRPGTLVDAGLGLRRCAGVVALTDDDAGNLAIAVATKLLRPHVPVLARCSSRDVAADLAVFGVEHIVDPYALFADHLALSLRAPGQYLLREWLWSVPEDPLPEPQYPPRGHWIVCGFGRFGAAVARALESEGNSVAVVEHDAAVAESGGVIAGRGTEPTVLAQAGIDRAVGLVAGTPDDVRNFSIVAAARAIAPSLYVVLRRNLGGNAALADALRADVVMQPAAVVVHAAMVMLGTPLLARFFGTSVGLGNAWANELLARLAGVLGDHAPENWVVDLGPRAVDAPARAAADAGTLTVGALLRDPRDRAEALPVIALALARDGALQLLPDDDVAVRPGDQLLMCGRGRGRRAQRLLLADGAVLAYVLGGRRTSGSFVWRRRERAVQRA